MAVYPSSPSPEVGPLAVTNGAYKAHFYTMGSGTSPSGYKDLSSSAVVGIRFFWSDTYSI